MLQTIREHTHGWIAGIIISLIILSFALWGIHSYFVGGGSNNIVAQVNHAEISKEQLAVTYERLRRQVQIQYGSNTPLTKKNDAALKQQALQALIDVEVMQQASLAQGFLISDAQIDNYLQNMPEFQVNGLFSLERFRQVLSATMLSTSDFLNLIKTNLLVDQPRLGILLSSVAYPNETDYVISLINQERNVSYLGIPFQYFLNQAMAIPAATIEAYYQNHQNDFMTPEQVNVDYLELSLNDLAAQMAPSDTELQRFYNENVNAYTNPKTWTLTLIKVPVATHANPDEVKQALAKAQKISDAVNHGQDINNLAKQYQLQIDATSFNKVGKTLEQIPASLQKVVAVLTKPGEASAPARTDTGFFVAKANTISEPKLLSFAQAKDKVKETYLRQQAEEKFAELRERLADMTYEHPESLAAAAKALNLSVKTSALFTRDKAANDISQYKKVRDTAFSHDVLNLQNNSDVIQINPNSVIVLRVKSHIPSALLPLNNVSQQIESKLKAQEADSRAEKLANELKRQLESGASLATVGNPYHFAVKEVGLIGRYSLKVDNAILDLAFRLPDPALAGGKANRTYGVVRLMNGYAIVALNSIKPGVPTDDKQSKIFAEQVQNSDGLLEYELYKRSETARAKIKVLI